MDITLKLTLDQVNAILTLLAEQPYKVSSPLIDAIKSQAVPQATNKTPE